MHMLLFDSICAIACEPHFGSNKTKVNSCCISSPWASLFHNSRALLGIGVRHASARTWEVHGAVSPSIARRRRRVVIGRGLTAVKIFMRLRLQKFVSPVYPRPLARVMTTVWRLNWMYIQNIIKKYIFQKIKIFISKKHIKKILVEKFFKYILYRKTFKKII